MVSVLLGIGEVFDLCKDHMTVLRNYLQDGDVSLAHRVLLVSSARLAVDQPLSMDEAPTTIFRPGVAPGLVP